jgi:ADP-ribosylglycohydrolase
MDLNKARGVMLGLAMGDALGARTEFLKFDEIRARFGKDGIRDLPALRFSTLRPTTQRFKAGLC